MGPIRKAHHGLFVILDWHVRQVLGGVRNKVRLMTRGSEKIQCLQGGQTKQSPWSKGAAQETNMVPPSLCRWSPLKPPVAIAWRRHPWQP